MAIKKPRCGHVGSGLVLGKKCLGPVDHKGRHSYPPPDVEAVEAEVRKAFAKYDQDLYTTAAKRFVEANPEELEPDVLERLAGWIREGCP